MSQHGSMQQGAKQSLSWRHCGFLARHASQSNVVALSVFQSTALFEPDMHRFWEWVHLRYFASFHVRSLGGDAVVAAFGPVHMGTPWGRGVTLPATIFTYFGRVRVGARRDRNRDSRRGACSGSLPRYATSADSGPG